MESHDRQPCILHLAGITLADYVPVEDVFDEKILDEAGREERPPDPLPFDKIPALFTSLDEWPSSTNLRCWSCPFTSFDGPPRFAPTYIRQGERGRLEVGVEGNFCTFNCAARYIDTTYPPQAHPAKHWRMRDNLCIVYYFFTGRRVRHIEPAPPNSELQEFGGTLTQDQYKALLRQMDPLHGLRDHRLGTTAPERARRGDDWRTMWGVALASCAETALADSPLEDLAAYPPLAAGARGGAREDGARGGAPGGPAAPPADGAGQDPPEGGPADLRPGPGGGAAAADMDALLREIRAL